VKKKPDKSRVDNYTSVSLQYSKRSQIVDIWQRLKKNKGALIGLIIITIILLMALYALLFIDYNSVIAMNMSERMQGPSLRHPFGTDESGRDLFLRVVYGSQYSVVIGIGSVAISLIIGLSLGSLAGYYGGLVDDCISRASDVLASIPSSLLGMVIVTVLGQSLTNLVIAVSVTAMPAFIRMSRSSVMTVRSQEYVEAAKAIGMSNAKIIFAQVVPNGLSPVIVTTTARMGGSIIEAAALSFLGFGVPVPRPEWGALVSAGRIHIRTSGYLTFFPGIMIMIVVLAFNLMGDGLRDALDPKLKR